MEGDVGTVGDPDERVDAGHALGDIAEVGARRDRLGHDPGGQRITAALALGTDPGGGERPVGAHRHFIGVLGGDDLDSSAGHQGGAAQKILHAPHQVLEGLGILRAHEDIQLTALGNDIGNPTAIHHDGVKAIHGQDLLAHHADPGQGEGGGIKGVAPHEGLRRGMRGHACEHGTDTTHPQPGLIGQVVGVGMGLNGSINAVEHAAPGEDLLGGVGLLGRSGLKNDPTGQRDVLMERQSGQCEEGSHGVGAHDVVSAGMTDTGQGVVLGKNGDGGGARSRTGGASGASGTGRTSRTGRLRGVRPDLGAQRRIHVVDPDSGLNTMGPQEVSHRGHRMMLAVSDLGMGMNIVR